MSQSLFFAGKIEIVFCVISQFDLPSNRAFAK